MRPTFTYYRYSDSSQGGGTIEDQRGACHACAKREGWRIAEEFEDRARSAWKHGREGRRGLDEMLKKVEQGHLRNGVVLVYDLDRLSRDFGVGYADILALHRAGVDIADTKHGIYRQDTLEGVLITVLSLHRAQQESDVKSRRVSAALQRRKREGKWVGMPPYGYRRKQVEGGVMLEVNEAQAAVVREAFSMLLNGHTQADIIRYCRRADPPRNHQQSSVTRILANRTYAGYLPGDGPLTDGNHPAIIDKATYHAAARALEKPPTKQTKASKTKLLGIVRCPICGDYMIRAGGNRSAGPYMTCRRRKYHARCPCKFVSARTVEEMALMYLRESVNYRATETPEPAATPEYLEAKIAALAARQARLIDAIGAGQQPKPLVEEISRLEQQVVELTAEKERAAAGVADDYWEYAANLTELPPNTGELIESITPSADYKTWTIKGRFGIAEVDI
jgi:site-specific DNA recombinase